MSTDTTDPAAERSFEKSLNRLEAIVRELETGDPDLQRAIDLYKEGKALVAQCESTLHGVQASIEALKQP